MPKFSQNNPLSPGEKPYFSKIITADQKPTSNIPVERYCLGMFYITTTDIKDVTN